MNAVITAGGRLEKADAERYGTDVKALVDVGGRSLLAIMIDALRGLRSIATVTVIGPRAVHQCGAAFDAWVDERDTGEENVMSALRAAAGATALFCASDLPFVTAASIAGLIEKTPPDAAASYPIFLRAEFEAAFPGARSSYFRLADGEWTGGSVFVVDAAVLLAKSDVIQSAFRARKNPAALAPLLGAGLMLRYAAGRVAVKDVVDRAHRLLGAPVYATRGADAALAMDCDGPEDIEYARRRFANATNEPGSSR